MTHSQLKKALGFVCLGERYPFQGELKGNPNGKSPPFLGRFGGRSEDVSHNSPNLRRNAGGKGARGLIPHVGRLREPHHGTLSPEGPNGYHWGHWMSPSVEAIRQFPLKLPTFKGSKKRNGETSPLDGQ